MKRFIILSLFFISLKTFAQPIIDTTHYFPPKSSAFFATTFPLGLNFSTGLEIRLFKQKRITLIPSANLLFHSSSTNTNTQLDEGGFLLVAMATLEARYYFVSQRKILVNDIVYKNRPSFYFSIKQFLIAEPFINTGLNNLDYSKGKATAALIGCEKHFNRFFSTIFLGYVFQKWNKISTTQYTATQILLLQFGITLGYKF